MIDKRIDDGFKTSADTALQCLYIAVDRSVADDVNVRVRRYIAKLEEAAREKGELVEALEHSLMCSDSLDCEQCDAARALLNCLKETNVKS